MLRPCFILLLMTRTLISLKQDIGKTVKLRSLNDKYPDYFVSIKSQGADNRVVISNSGVDDEWIVRNGLAGEGISLESVTGTGYIRHSYSQAWVDPLKNEGLYKNDTSFTVEDGLAGKGISLRSVYFPNHLLRWYDDRTE